MTLLYTQGFDHFDDGNELLSTLYDAVGASLILSNWGSGRFNYGRSIFTDSASAYWEIGGGRFALATLYFGLAMKIDKSDGVYSSGNAMWDFRDISDYQHLKMHLVGTTFDFRNGETDTQLFTPVEIIPSINKWYYVELKLVISATVGEIVIKVNETEIVNETGLNTKHSSGGNNIDIMKFAGGQVDVGITYDDIYVDDSQFHGDCRIKTFFPDSDSATHTDFVRSGGSNDYECVDENDPNSDTDYIYANVVGDISAFGITTGVLGIVKAVNLVHVMRKDDGGDRKIKHLVRSNSIDYQGVEKSIISDYVGVDHIWELDPDDSGAWDQTKIEAAEFGLEITA
jgi:hypothetical protein